VILCTWVRRYGFGLFSYMVGLYCCYNVSDLVCLVVMRRLIYEGFLLV